jgi:hypothetical protein
MLFAPPRPPVWVPRTKAMTLGRSAECDLPVDSPRASRVHARVSMKDDRVVVEDLGSKNGTFVNGERVEGERALRPGDRLDVGGVTVTFCRVESLAACDAPSDEATVVCEQKPAGRGDEALRGNLEEVPAAAVLQLLADGRKTGLLSIVGGHGAARLWFDDGRPVHAEHEEEQGLEAAFRICRLVEGRFLFAPDRAARWRTIDQSVTALLLEANRLADECRRG